MHSYVGVFQRLFLYSSIVPLDETPKVYMAELPGVVMCGEAIDIKTCIKFFTSRLCARILGLQQFPWIAPDTLALLAIWKHLNTHLCTTTVISNHQWRIIKLHATCNIHPSLSHQPWWNQWFCNELLEIPQIYGLLPVRNIPTVPWFATSPVDRDCSFW